MLPLAVGVVTPGLVDEVSGIVRYASNFKWRDMPLRARIEDAIRIPVIVAHDVGAAGLAESMFGVSRNAGSSAFIALGTGIAAYLTSGGTAIRGATSSAGELGHIPVYPGGELCACGQRGCLEVYASGAGIARRYATRTQEAGPTAADVANRAGTDPQAAVVWGEAIDALSAAIATLTLVLDPQVVVIGGGVAGAGKTLLEPLRRTVESHLGWRSAPAIERSHLGASAAKIGAAVLAMQALGREVAIGSWSFDPGGEA